MTRYGKEFVRLRYPDAVAKKIGAVREVGQRSPYEEARWEICRSAQPSLGESPLGEGPTEEAAWNNAKKNIADAERRKMKLDSAPHDPIFQQFKNMALRGSTDGPHSDQGILLVIREIEQRGEFTPIPIIGILLMLADVTLAATVLTEAERVEGREFLAAKGWTAEEGKEFALGYRAAAGALCSYEVPKA